MRQVKIADLKNNLSRHLEGVRRGGELTVCDRETPVARLVPFAPEHAADGRVAEGDAPGAARLADLVRQGIVFVGDLRVVATWLETHRPARRPKGSRSAVAVLLDMRRRSVR